MVNSVFQFKRGDHICVFYRDAYSLLDTLAPYLRDGLRNGERCFCAQKSAMIPRLRRALESLGIDTQREIRRGALEIHSEDEVYFPNGGFEPEAMMEMLERSIEQSLQQGYSGFRTVGEMSWAIEGRNMCDQLIQYERMVEAAYPGKQAIGICQYPAHKFAREILDNVLAEHRLALEETMVSTNHASLSMRRGEYVADIVADRFDPATSFHYVIQRRGGNEVLAWGVELGMEDAMRTSQDVIDDLDSGPTSNNAVIPWA